MKALPASRWSWSMLFSRITLFILFQALFALGFALAGSSKAWEDSANWWPLFVTLANLVCIFLLVKLYEKDGRRYWDIFRFDKATVKKDLLTLLGILLIVAPVSFLPNILLAKLLFGDPLLALDLLVRPLPFWAAIAGFILFPVTQGLAEIALYFSFVMPAFESRGMKPWLALSLSSLVLGFQHIGVPFLFNGRYLIWRGFMFLPFAFLLGIVLHWRPRLLPYLAIVHVLMDLSVGVMLLPLAY